MVFAPVITRIYGPEAFGVQGVFMSLVNPLSTVAALTFPIAIVLPKSDNDARGLTYLSIYIGIVMAIVTTLLLWLFGRQFLELMNSEEIADFAYLLPLFMLFSVFSALLGQWLIRKKAFKLTAKVSLWQALIINIIKVGLGLVHPSVSILIVTNTFGNLLQAGLLLLGFRQQVKTERNKPELRQHPDLWMLAKQHKDFPLLRAPQVLLNAISHSLPVIMLATFFGATSAGFYTLANSILSMPAGLIGTAVMQVFYPKANGAYQNGECIKSLIIKATIGMAVIGFVPFLLIIFFGPYLFETVFGKGWEIAGKYAQWLSAWLFFGYINKPAVTAIPVLKIQSGLLIYEFFSTGLKVISLAIGYFKFHSAIIAIALFSSSGILAYSYLIAWVIFSAKPHKLRS